jgi:chromosome segregation ATPase
MFDIIGDEIRFEYQTVARLTGDLPATRLDAFVDAMQSYDPELARKLATVEEERDNLQTQVNDLEKENDRLAKERDAAAKEAQTYYSDLDKAEAKIAKMEARVAELETAVQAQAHAQAVLPKGAKKLREELLAAAAREQAQAEEIRKLKHEVEAARSMVGPQPAPVDAQAQATIEELRRMLTRAQGKLALRGIK